MEAVQNYEKSEKLKKPKIKVVLEKSTKKKYPKKEIPKQKIDVFCRANTNILRQRTFKLVYFWTQKKTISFQVTILAKCLE